MAEEELFGERLSNHRLHAGLSVRQLAALIHFSPSQVTKVEKGRRPSADFARQCDAVFGTGRAFTDLVPTQRREAHAIPPSQPDELWTMNLSPDGRLEFGSQRVGAAVVTGIMSWAPGSSFPYPANGSGAVRAYRVIFDQLRLLGQSLGPADLVPSLVAATNALRLIAARAPERERLDALQLAARFAEYTGWMAQEKGDDRAALWWTDQATVLATSGGDEELLAYAYVRRALVSLYRHDPSLTVELAQQAQRGHSHVRILGLGAQREAQGHAIAGDELACHRLLERAAGLLAESTKIGTGDAPVLGTSALDDPLAMATGWCLHELGEYRRAVEILEPALDRIPARAERARARYGARLCLALASIRELEQACAVLEPILNTLPRIDSATIREDIVGVARTLNRWRTAPVVQETMPRLRTVLRTDAAAVTMG